MTKKQNEIDKISGVQTTGHEWDGIKELDNPMPRWWLIVFYLCIIWAIGYWVVYPAWPTLSGDGERGGTEGSQGWTQYKQLKEAQAEIVARKAVYQGRFDQASYAEIKEDPSLYAFALAGGKAAFGDNCATCHGTGGAGASGYPNLNDDDWLWGGDIDAIEQTLRYGVRSGHDEARFNEMPAFGSFMDTADIQAVADYVYAVAHGEALPEAGEAIFDEQCSVCHGSAGVGVQELGGPKLADAIWLYGGSKSDIVAQIRNPKHGIMPAWDGRLSDSTIRQLTVYVHSLGGGE
ncbi:cytochrome-c oxidase, cbb3-type subunit III [Kordiimonas pumila]|uniref:Cbb3-type cytochrome c oxidase subunit n=1 Tax=Kordiimonas pumila TaxID=2161677 RepID=A0ABV7D6H4_9PROT|nr:cytochrome-c oxidase, cbb3-type subunit III [Kordiimonas pumila]